MWIAVVLFLSIILLLFYLDSVKPKNYPPGPKWFPMLGSAYTVAKLRKKYGTLANSVAHMSRKYGPLIGLKIGQEKIVMAYGMQAIKEFLMNENLNGRPTGPFYELRTFGRKGVLLTDEAFWTEQRKFILRHLREFGFGKRNMSEMIEQEAEVMVNHIKEQMGKKGEVVLQMDTMFGIHVLNTLWTMLAGTKYSPDDENLIHLQSILNKLFKNIDMMGTLFSHFPILRYFAPEMSGYNLYMQTHKPIWTFINKEIEEHKRTHIPGEPRDLIDVYLEMINSPDKPGTFTEEQLLAICLDFFMAGSETTTKSFGFCFLHLILNPEVQKKAQEEIDSVVGRNRTPSLNDRPNLPYVEAIVMETLRHFMAMTFGVPHRALRDTSLCGYYIPKGTMIVPTFHSVFFGAECIWDDPKTFRPERFLENDTSVLDNFIPFGIGKRRCLGESLARGNLFIFIASLLQNFNFSVPEGHPKPCTDAQDGVTASPVPYKGLISLRS
ncbi:PREDICTED: probable cytochrome P450 303a1 [Nicrophorus vespilloides]|uniref:Probable cytochrome P450 303a1 n=1 Tax=Nicrophorus vespilloides TaxID=110193 RepID=A0ABM1MK47_NICVS|nr:PREDICTED: probable cytochrome P450 303a1 [Nicrophorus vespilloides]